MFAIHPDYARLKCKLPLQCSGPAAIKPQFQATNYIDTALRLHYIDCFTDSKSTIPRNTCILSPVTASCSSSSLFWRVGACYFIKGEHAYYTPYTSYTLQSIDDRPYTVHSMHHMV